MVFQDELSSNLKIRLVALNLFPASHSSVVRKELHANAIGQEAFLSLQLFKFIAVVFREAPFL